MTLRAPLGVTNRIATQIVALVVLSSVAAWIGIASAIVMVAPEFQLSPTSARHAGSIVAVLRGLEALPASGRAQLLAAYQHDDFAVGLFHDGDVVQGRRVQIPTSIESWLVRQLPPGVTLVGANAEGDKRFSVAARLSDEGLVIFHLAWPVAPQLNLPIGLMIGFTVALVVLLLAWAVRRLVSPLSRFASAVDRFGLEGHEAILREEGPDEIRQAARAFNRMQQRIVRLIEGRTRMLMAISHDLRTPLTRLRLRIEEAVDRKAKPRMLDDIALMNASIASAIAYVREGRTTEEPEDADLPSLVKTICNQFEDAGHTVVYDGPRHFSARCLPQALERAIVNLVDNAVKFGSCVTVRLETSRADTVSIQVEDDGPGIPDAEKPLVLEPFYRSDAAPPNSGGFGLGLTIALTVARHHEGTLTLHNRVPNGTLVRLTIPRARSPSSETAN
jgi:signal transduction histidine kinase